MFTYMYRYTVYVYTDICMRMNGDTCVMPEPASMGYLQESSTKHGISAFGPPWKIVSAPAS